MKIIFESHSTSIDNEGGIASGHFDPPLSQKGILQAQALGKRHEANAIEVVYCSDLIRSRETAQVAFETRTVEIIEDLRLREWNYGELNGAKASEVENQKQRCMAEPFLRGESLMMALSRIYDFLDEVNSQRDFKKPILIIGHRAVFYALEHRYKNRSLEEMVASPWSWQPGWYYG